MPTFTVSSLGRTVLVGPGLIPTKADLVCGISICLAEFHPEFSEPTHLILVKILKYYWKFKCISLKAYQMTPSFQLAGKLNDFFLQISSLTEE